MRSIRRQLLITLFIVLLLTFSISGITSYFVAAHEVRELFDAQLVQSARVLTGVMNRPAGKVDWENIRESLNNAARTSAAGALLAEAYSYERKVAIQVWSPDGELILRTLSAPEYAFSPLQRGFYRLQSGSHKWYVYTTRLPENGYWLMVAERADVRRELSLGIAVSLAGACLLGLALALWLSWHSLNHELKPVNALRNAITRRDPQHMHAIELPSPRKELALVVDELNYLLDRVTDSIERERRFLADAAHELRTPLTVLRLQAESALSASAAPEQRTRLTRLISGVDRSTRVVEQLLLLARLDANAVAFEPQTLSLDNSVRDAIAALAPLAQSRRQELGLNYDGPGLPVSGEPALLGALLTNLIENGLRYSPEGGAVDVFLWEDQDNIMLQVRDTGPGIDPGHLAEITARFVRRHEQDTQGTGLGLAIASHIADLHHARLELANGSVRGLVVTLSFPGRGQPVA